MDHMLSNKWSSRIARFHGPLYQSNKYYMACIFILLGNKQRISIMFVSIIQELLYNACLFLTLITPVHCNNFIGFSSLMRFGNLTLMDQSYIIYTCS